MVSQFGNLPPQFGGYTPGQGTKNFNSTNQAGGYIQPPYTTGLNPSGGGGGGGGGVGPAAAFGGYGGIGTNGSDSGGLKSWHMGLPTASDFAPGFGWMANNYQGSNLGAYGGSSPGALPDQANANPQPASSGTGSPGPNGTYGFAGGGMIPDSEEAGGGSITDPQAALGAVQKALAYGRSLFKLPATMFANSAIPQTQEPPKEDNDGGIVGADRTPDHYGNISGGVDQTGTDSDVEGLASGGVVPDAPDRGEAGNYKEGVERLKAKMVPNAGDQADQQVKDRAAKGLPQEGSYDAGGVIDAGDMSNPSAGGMPAQPQDNAPAQGPGANLPMPQMPQGLQAYVMGAGSMPADQAMALEQQVDPQGQMDPAMRKLLAIANAGDPKQQFSLMQHYRQRFQLLNAYAQAAASGAPGRPANLPEATQAATRAYHNAPTGQSVSFAPAGNGVRVHIGQLGQSAQQPQQQQGFDSGGTVADDQAAISGNPQTDAFPGASALAGMLPEAGDDVPADTQGMPGSSSITGAGGAGQDFTISVPDFIKKFLQTPWDKHVEQGVSAPDRETIQQAPDQPAVQEPAALDTQEETQPGGKTDERAGIGAGAKYKPIGVPDARGANSLGGETDQFTVPSESGAGPTQVSVTNGPQMLRHVPTKEALAYLANQNRGLTAMERAVLTEAGRNTRNERNVNAREDIADKNVAGRNANSRLRFGSARVNAERNLGQQPNIGEINNEADQIENAPRSPQPGAAAPPSQNDVAYLLAHPEVAQRFDARFGAGAAAKYMRQ